MRNCESIDSIVDLNLSEVESQITNIWKMTWEQVLLLALYARRQYFEEDSFSFRQRMRLIHVLENLKQKNFHGVESNAALAERFLEQYIVILKKVENGCGSNDVLEYLFDDESDVKVIHGQQNKTVKKIISESIERKGIAFPKASREMLYSYYTMYKALKDLIRTLQVALNYRPPNIRKVYYACMVHIFKESRKSIFYQSVQNIFSKPVEDNGSRQGTTEELSNEQYIESELESFTLFFSTVEKKKELKELFYQTLIDGNPLKEGFEEYSQFIGVGEWAKSVCNELSLIGDRERIGFDDLYTFKEEDNLIQIALHKEQIRDLSNLGLLQSLFDEIATQLEVKEGSLKKQSKAILSRDAVESVERISDWYIQNSVDLFSRINQIPKLVAYLLKFDTEQALGVFDVQIGGVNLDGRGLNGYRRPRKISEKNFLISVIIKYCLYHNMDFKVLYFNYVYDSPISDKKSTVENSMAFVKYFDDNLKQQIKVEGNEIFQEWAELLATEDDKKESKTQADIDNKVHNRVMNRFKRMPKHEISKTYSSYYLDSEDLLNTMIKKQKYQSSTDNAVTYPFNSSFPLPLWVNRIN